MKKKSIKTSSLILSNIPNFLTISRIILAFVVVYLIFTRAELITVVVVFAIAAFTDFLDGQLARRFKWTSEFGRRSDMIADRFLWVGTALAFIVSYGLSNKLEWYHGIQLLLMMSREIITSPFALMAFFSGRYMPKARYIAKVTTLIQGFALPSLLLSTDYVYWNYISWPLSVIAACTGFKSALYYIHDTNK